MKPGETDKLGRRFNVKPKACVACGAVFQPTVGFQRFCSRKCQLENARQTKTCPMCETQFTTDGWKPTKFCSSKCSNKASAAKRKGQRGRFGSGPLVNRPKPASVCETCKQKFESAPATRYCSKSCRDTGRAEKRRTALGQLPIWSIKSKGESACRNCGRPAVHLHHIVPRSKSKVASRDVVRNGMPLCRECHWGWHHRRIVIYRRALTPEEATYASEIAGPVWLDMHYPEGLSEERHLALAGCDCDSCVAVKYRQAEAVKYYGGVLPALEALTGDRYVPERKA